MWFMLILQSSTYSYVEASAATETFISNAGFKQENDWIFSNPPAALMGSAMVVDA
jgi:hypothetical protein